MAHEPLDWSPPVRAKAPRRRARRWLFRLLALFAVLAAGYLLLTRSFITRAIVVSRIGSLMGGVASAGSVRVEPGGLIEIDHAVIRARGVEGEAADVLTVERLRANADFWSLIFGDPVFHSIALDAPVLRLSQSSDDGSLNIASLKLPAASRSAPPAAVPRITLNRGVIEIGEHADTPQGPAFTSLKRVDVSGVVEQSPGEQGASIISFRQGGAANAVSVHGRVARDGLSVTVSGMDLRAWPPDAVPSRMRDFFRSMNLEGAISGITFSYSFAGGVQARMALADVAVSLPITEQPDKVEGVPVPLPGPARWLRLHAVNGDLIADDQGVHASLAGLVEQLPCEVSFHSRGITAESAFTATLSSNAFQLGDQNSILRFAPWVVRKRLHQFSDPTGLVDARVTITRADPAPAPGGGQAPGPVSAEGYLRFRDASASFHKFPYRFNHMTGDFAFTDSRIDIRQVQGVSPTGARIFARGWISPLNDDPAMELHVSVTGVPIDEALEEGMRHRRKALEAVFSRPRFQELQDKGLIATGEQHRAAVAALAALPPDDHSPAAARWREIAARPVFDLGGVVSVNLVISREEGPGDLWHDRVVIDVPLAGILPENVPIPLIARGVTIIKTDDDTTVRGGSYAGLRGGRADISARIDFDLLDRPGAPFVPEVVVAASGVPVDDILINAVPDGPPSLGDGLSVPQMLAALRIAGTVDCRAALGMNSDKDGASYVVAITTEGASASPLSPRGESRLVLSGMGGAVLVTQDDTEVELSGDLLIPGTEPVSAGRADIRASIAFARPEKGAPSRLGVSALAESLDTRARVEDVIRVFAPQGADAVAALREAHEPRGVVDLDTAVARSGEDPVSVVIDASNANDLEFTFGPGRLRATSDRGSVRVIPGLPGQPGDMRFSGFRARTWFDGADDGTLVADGPIRTDGSPIPGETPLAIDLTGARMESGLVRTIIGARAGARIADLLQSANPRGRFDLNATLTPPPAGAAADAPWSARGSFTPRALALTLPRGEFVASSIDGRVEFSPEGGVARQVRVTSDEGWSVLADATFSHRPDTGLALQTTFAADAPSMTPGLRTALPQALDQVLTAVAFSADGPLRADPVSLSITFPPGDAPAAVKSSGRVRASGVSADVGAAVSRAQGVLDFSYQHLGGDDPASLELWSICDSLDVAGISMTDARVRAVSGERGEIFFPHISAQCHAGRLAGSASLFPRPDDRRDYAVDLRLSGVRFASVLADLDAVPADSAAPKDPDRSRGMLDAGVSLRGIAGDPSSRIGRGTITIGGGRVMSMPLLIPIVRFSNLQPPLDEALDFALVDFYIDADTVSIEEASVQSHSLAIYGFGTATWPALDLDLRFRSRSKARIPVLSAVVEGIRDELVTIAVTGNIREPDVGLSSMSRTARMIRRGMGDAPSEQERRLDQIEQRSGRDARRAPALERSPVAPR